MEPSVNTSANGTYALTGVSLDGSPASEMALDAEPDQVVNSPDGGSSAGSASGSTGDDGPPPSRQNRPFAFNRRAFLITAVIILILALLAGAVLLLASRNKKEDTKSPNNFAVSNLSVDSESGNAALQVGGTDQLTINGQLQVAKTLVVTPTATPGKPVAGQIYYNSNDNILYYYNGTQFVPMAPPPQSVTTLGGASGVIGLGNGLQMVGGQLSVTPAAAGVTSVQGQTGAVNFTPGQGISINGTTIGNTGLLSLAAGNGLSVTTSGGQATVGIVSPVSVANGGTGVNGSAYNTNGVFYYDGTKFVTTAAPSAANQCLMTTSLSPNTAVFDACPGGGSGANQALSNLTTTAINTDLLPGANNAIDLGSSSKGFKNGYFGGTLAVQGTSVTIGTASSTTGALILANSGSANLGTIQVASLAQPSTYVLPDPGSASDTFCLKTLSNCAGDGAVTSVNGLTGGLSITSTGGSITVTPSGSTINLSVNGLDTCTTCANQALSNLTTTAINTDLLPGANNAIDLGSSSKGFKNGYFGGTLAVQGTSVTIGTASSTTGALILANSGSANLGTIQVASLAQPSTYVLPDPGSASDTFCLKTLSNCAGDGAVTSVNGLTGGLSITSTGGSITVTPSGSTINLSVNGLDTCTTCANQALSNLTTTAINTDLLPGANNAIDLGSSSKGFKNGYFGGTLAVQGTSVTIGTASSTTGALILANSGSANLGTIQVASLAQPSTYVLPDPGSASDTFCLKTLSNCAGDGAVTSVNGLTGGLSITSTGGSITVTPSGSTINLSVNGLDTCTTCANQALSNLTTTAINTDLLPGANNAIDLGSSSKGFKNGYFGGTLAVQGTSVTIGTASSTTGALILANSGSANLGTIQVASLAQPSTYVLPDPGSASDTFCLKTLSNCAGDGAVTSVNGLTGGLSITSTGGSITVTPSGSTINLSVNGLDTCTTCANQALSNLTTTAINTDLLPGANNAIDLGSSSKGFKNGYFGGTLAVQGTSVTIGTASSTTGALILANSGSANLGTIQVASLAQPSTYVLPDPGSASDTFCLKTLSNCAGDGAVTSVNGLTGGLSITSTGGSITVTPSGSTINLSVNGLDTCTTCANQALSNLTTTAINTDLLPGANNAIDLGSSSKGFKNGYFGGTLAVQGTSVTIGTASSTTGALILANSGSANLGTIQVASLAQPSTYVLPDPGSASDTFCLKTLSNCAGDGAVTSVNGLTGGLSITSTGGSITVTPSGSTINLSVNGLDTCTTCANQALSNLTTTAINTDLLPGANNAIDLGSSSKGFKNGYFGGDLSVAGTYNSNTFNGNTLTFGAASAATIQSATSQALNIDTGGGASLNLGNANTTTINLGANNAAHTINIGSGGTTTDQSVAIGSTHGTGYTAIYGGVAAGSINSGILLQPAGGSTNVGVLVKPVSNTSQAFQIQNAGAQSLFSADTTNNRIKIGDSDNTSSANTTLFQVDSAATGNLPTCSAATVGGIVYDSSVNAVKLCQGGSPAWATVGSGVSNLQGAYDGSAGAAPSILTTSGNKAVTIQTVTGGTGIGAGNELFGVHASNAGNTIGNSLFTVNSNGIGINIGTTAPTTGSNIDLAFGGGANRAISVLQSSSGVGKNLTINAGQGASGANNGGDLILQGGARGTSGTTGSVIVRANGTDSTTAFSIQNSSSQSLFNVDSTQAKLTVNSGVNALQSWTLNSPNLTDARGDGGAVTYNGRIYYFGGSNGSAPQDDTYVGTVSPNTGNIASWTKQTANMLNNSAYGGYTQLNGYLYALGGEGNGASDNAVEYAKIGSDGPVGTWKEDTDSPLPGSTSAYYSAAAAYNGYVYSVGGIVGGSPSNRVIYAKQNTDGSLGSWSTFGNLPENIEVAKATIANGYIYVNGSWWSGSSWGTVRYAKIGANGAISGSWQTETDLIPQALTTSAFVAMNGKLYAMNGYDGTNNQSNVAYATLNADGSTTAWTASGNTLSARNQQGAVVLNGYLYLVGGCNNGACSGVTNRTEYASVPRTVISGALDLVGNTNGYLADNDTGTSLTAGNTLIAGSLSVTKSTALKDTTISGQLIVNNYANFQNTTNSTTAFTVQNATGTNLINVDTSTNIVHLVNAPVTGGVIIGSYADVSGTFTQAIAIGANLVGNANASIGIYLGSLAGANSVTNIRGGTGSSAVTVQAGSGGGILIGTDDNNTLTLGSTGSTSTITLGRSTAGETVDIANGQVAASATNTINIGTSATSSGKNVIMMGSTNGASALTLRSGTAGTIFNSGGGASGYLFRNTGSTTAVTISTANITGTPHAAAATLKVAQDSGTGRSINASGTIASGGADYAEYIPWSGPAPAQGSIVTYNGSTYVVSSPTTAGFVGNDKLGEDSILVTFAGQVPVRVTGPVSVGDILIDNGDGTAKAVNPATASIAQLFGKLGIAQEASSGGGTVRAAIGTTSSTVAGALQQSSSGSFSDLNVSGNTTLDSLTVTGSATIGGNLTVNGSLAVTGSISTTDITIAGHVITAGGQPTATAQAGAGGGAAVSVDGNDTTGTITITTGSAPAAGDLAKILFSRGYGAAPRVVLSAANDKAADLKFYKSGSSASDFMFSATDAPAANTTYKFDYFIAQ